MGSSGLTIVLSSTGLGSSVEIRNASASSFISSVAGLTTNEFWPKFQTRKRIYEIG